MIIKKALKNHLPKEVIHRRKQPFHMPLDEWFAKGLKDYFNELLQDDINLKLFNKNYIKKILDS